jgi:uncharacterized membrane protein
LSGPIGGANCASIPHPKALIVSRAATSLFFIGAGVNHFIMPAAYQRIIPPKFPSPALLVALSGIFEIAGGLGLLARPLRHAAGWGLIALLIAVFPANVYMALAPGKIPDHHVGRWLLWLRLPMQGVLIAWVWFIALRKRREMQPGVARNVGAGIIGRD